MSYLRGVIFLIVFSMFFSCAKGNSIGNVIKISFVGDSDKPFTNILICLKGKDCPKAEVPFERIFELSEKSYNSIYDFVNKEILLYQQSDKDDEFLVLEILEYPELENVVSVSLEDKYSIHFLQSLLADIKKNVNQDNQEISSLLKELESLIIRIDY